MATVRVACFSGGGFRFFTHVGMAAEMFVKPEHAINGVAGVSAGSIVSSFLGWTTDGTFPAGDQMLYRIKKLLTLSSKITKTSDIYGSHGGFAALVRKILPFKASPEIRNLIGALADGRSGAYNMDPLFDLLTENIPFNSSWLNTVVGTVIVDVEDSPYREVDLTGMSLYDGLKSVVASCSVPVLSCPVRIQNTWQVDGGVVNQSPYAAAMGLAKRLAGPDDEIEVYLLNCTPMFNGLGYPVKFSAMTAKPSILNMAEWTLERILHAACIDDLKRAYWVNNRVRMGQSKSGQRIIKIYSVDPPAAVPADTRNINAGQVAASIENGRRGALAFMRNPKERLIEKLASPAWWAAD